MARRLFNYYWDDETGEIINYHIDDETGEPIEVATDKQPPTRKVDTKSTAISVRFPSVIICQKRKFQDLKANIIAGSNTVSHRLLLIPTVLLFPALFSICLTILEIYLHVMCHKHNKNLKDPNLYYRSPFHVITRIFCGVCRDSDTASKIGHIQDKRKYHYDCLKSAL